MSDRRRSNVTPIEVPIWSERAMRVSQVRIDQALARERAGEIFDEAGEALRSGDRIKACRLLKECSRIWRSSMHEMDFDIDEGAK